MLKKRYAWTGLLVLLILVVACQPQTVEVEVIREVEVVVTATPEPAPGTVVQDYEGELIISVWGGVTEEWIRAHAEPVFKEIYPNVTVIYDVGGMSARYNKLLAQKGSPEIDLFVSTSEALFAAIKEGLVVKINRDNVPNMEGLYDWALPAPDYGAAYAAIAEGLGYNPDFFGDNPPTSWRDLWRPEIQGKISVPAIGHSQMPQFIAEAAELYGGSLGNIEPGLEALAELDPTAQTFFYTGWNALFDAGDVVLAVDFDYYVNFMADQGSNIKFVIPEEGAWGSTQHLSVVAGTENQAMVETFINVMLSPEVQRSVAYDLLNAPASPDVELTPELEERLAVAGDSLNQVKWFDEKFSVEVRPGWTEMMNEHVAPAWGE
ncbi:MAG: extracellular solute-binding protein [Anaerolineae bacterium]